MGRKRNDKLLGKKRLNTEKDNKDNKSEEEEEEEEENEKKELMASDKVFFYEVTEEEEEEESESEESKPVQRLFSDKDVGFSKGLFDNSTTKKEQKEPKNESGGSRKPLFDFSQKEENKSSLFGDKKSSLFPDDNKSSLFSNQPLFGPSNNKDGEEKEAKENDDDKEKNEEGKDGEDVEEKSEGPKQVYNPEVVEGDQDDNNKYVKRYVKKVDKVLLFDKNEKKYISKEEGFISIETQTTKKDENENKTAVFIFRNNIGGLIIEGFLNDKINKIDSYEKNGKHVANFVMLMNDKDNKISMTQCKVPFNNKEDSEKFVNIYNEAIKYIKKEIKEFSKP